MPSPSIWVQTAGTNGSAVGAPSTSRFLVLGAGEFGGRLSENGHAQRVPIAGAIAVE